jgi:hypothetical protein
MKSIVVYTILAIFAITWGITLLGVLKIVTIADGFLWAMTTASVAESAGVLYAILGRHDLFGQPELKPNSDSEDRSPDPIIIEAAEVIVSHYREDVTEIVRGKVFAGVLNVLMDLGSLKAKDNLPGQRKILVIHCKIFGRDRKLFVPEGERLIFP